MRPTFFTLFAGALVAALFLFEARRSPVRVVAVGAKRQPQAAASAAAATQLQQPQSPPEPVATRPESPVGPAPTASAAVPSAAVSVAPCRSLSCASRGLESLEPSWADLTFQPNIDWNGGGVRGDCVAGELEYIMPKYCDPAPAENRKR